MNKFDIYQEITNRILAEIDKGVVPWHKPWSCSCGAVSHTNGRPYSILNQFLLATGQQKLYEYGEYITFTQIQKEGGHIKKGEKSHFVVFWKMYEKKETDEDGKEQVKTIPLLWYYNVWEVGQCEGITRKYAEEENRPKAEPIESADKVVRDYFERETCKLNLCETNKACYSPVLDIVTAPQISQYVDSAEYYSTLYHEMGHSTGHQSRLNRDLLACNFGNDSYSKEELVAEMTSAFLCNHVGLESEKCFKNSASYIEGWSRKLREDKNLFVSASSKAESATKYILNGKE